MALDVKPTTGVWTGAGFPFRYGVMGTLGPKNDDDVIATAIQIMLKTRVGSWKPDPAFGSHLWDLVFEILDEVTIQLIQYYTVRDIEEQLPYVEVRGVEVNKVDDHIVRVRIAYVRQADATAKIQQTAVVFDKRFTPDKQRAA